MLWCLRTGASARVTGRSLSPLNASLSAVSRGSISHVCGVWFDRFARPEPEGVELLQAIGEGHRWVAELNDKSGISEQRVTREHQTDVPVDLELPAGHLFVPSFVEDGERVLEAMVEVQNLDLPGSELTSKRGRCAQVLVGRRFYRQRLQLIGIVSDLDDSQVVGAAHGRDRRAASDDRRNKGQR